MNSHYEILNDNKIGQYIIHTVKAYLRDIQLKHIHIGEIAYLHSGALAVSLYLADEFNLYPQANGDLIKVETSSLTPEAVVQYLKELEPYIKVIK